MPKFTFALVASNGHSAEKSVIAINEKEAREKVWDILCDDHKNAIESIDLIDVEEISEQ
jgi:ribosomal protein L20A (L18A)